MIFPNTKLDFNKYKTIFIINPDTTFYLEFVHSLYHIFLEKKYTVIKHINDFDISKLSININDLVIIISSTLMYGMSNYNKNKELIDTINGIGCHYVLYQSEPKDIQDIYTNIYNKLNVTEIWTYTHDNMINCDQKYRFIPPLYTPYYEKNTVIMNSLINKNRDTLVFMGNITEYRKPILNELKKYKFFSIKNTIFTPERYKELYKRNLFFINLHRRDHLSTEFFRITSILSNCCVIISEHCNKEDEKLLENTNIYFVNKNEILNKYYDLRKSLSNEDIFTKFNNYKNKCNQNKYLFK